MKILGIVIIDYNGVTVNHASKGRSVTECEDVLKKNAKSIKYLNKDSKPLWIKERKDHYYVAANTMHTFAFVCDEFLDADRRTVILRAIAKQATSRTDSGLYDICTNPPTPVIEAGSIWSCLFCCRPSAANGDAYRPIRNNQVAPAPL